MKRAGYANDVVIDTRGFTGHKEKLQKILRSGDRSQYALGLELKEWDDQLKLLDDAKAKEIPIVLSKRLTTTGNIRYGLTKVPSDPTIRPDPCDRHNDVHLPV